MRLTPEQAAYIAGFVDGEGMIRSDVSSHKGYERVRIQLAIYNTNREVIEWIARLTGSGSVHVRKRNAKHKVSYALQMASRDARDLIAAIAPYLIVKRKHAELVAAYEQTVMSYADGRKAGLSKPVLQRRAVIHRRFQVLNRKGA